MNATDPHNTKPKRGPAKRAGKNMDSGTDTHLQAHLGKNLKAVYQAVVDEPVPDRLIKLLDELERKEKNGM